MSKTRDVATHSRNKKCKVSNDRGFETHATDVILLLKDCDNDLIPSEWLKLK
jgi:hypothetical protein